jgi:hypothetical protein
VAGALAGPRIGIEIKHIQDFRTTVNIERLGYLTSNLDIGWTSSTTYALTEQFGITGDTTTTSGSSKLFRG